MRVSEIIENEDGSVTATFDLTGEDAEAMCRNGILWALVSGATGITAEQVMRDWAESQEKSANAPNQSTPTA